ncbi:unnamed protein product (macronuclear) [Paramecium tetraurelia]|uniref:Protein kinase domain-containing protein n=1 Tax=Paramecium tetraurelia TaxID=5888 RepID=A0DZ99_PARTE|nr:uncharacterized protein GSPATT00003335001 [Paramecium tetraurelia]CAK88366.1 unnamed protein product [Paramecium tetraurelia]|eukprot:XP_001455763.1 hypothetical protein (macronuclear) [Paramecium tetraurelia strain d4-2]
MNSYYTVNILTDQIRINQFKSQKTKYVCPLNFDNKVYWYTEQQRIHAFGIIVKKKVKFFKGNHKELEEMRRLIGGKIVFDGIVNLFKCSNQIGEGADSKVFRVEDTVNKSLWALKCLERKDDFYQEIRMHQNLEHSHIIQFKEYFQGEQYYYIIMELMGGQTLSKLIERNLITTHQQCKIIIQALLQALVYLKGEGIVHRDIKPANIMFAQSGKLDSLKLVDFNFAMKQDDTNAKPILYGMYTAPEALQDSPIQNDKMDVYSCGAILYKLYSGEDIHPIRYMQESNVFYNILRNGSIDFKVLEKANTPKQAIRLIRAMLEMDPCKRVNAQEALQLEYFRNESLSPNEKRSRFQQRHQNDSFKIGITADFEINADQDARCANVRKMEIHKHH